MVFELVSSTGNIENQHVSSIKIDTNGTSITNSNQDELWVFGYGSMIWKVDFPIESAHRGYIEGFARRFYQNSIDHRGTIDKPGRVVTLTHCHPNSRVYGMGYKIKPGDREQVLDHLDYREINGYERLNVNFHILDDDDEVTGTKKVLVYIATRDNPSFAGFDDDLEKIANQICECTGKSGKNCDYVYNLADAMRQLYPRIKDPHLFDLEKVVRRQMKQKEG